MIGTAIKNREAELSTFRNRVLVAGLLILIAFGVLVATSRSRRPDLTLPRVIGTDLRQGRE